MLGGRAAARILTIDAQKNKMRNVMADALSGTEAGRQVFRQALWSVAERIKVRGASHQNRHCEMREGDCGVLNSCQTFLEGKVIVRPQRFSVGIWTIDQDVVRELHARPSTEVFVQFPKVNARQLQLRSPSVAQWHILKLNAHRYARELPVDGLCFPPDLKELSVDMYFGLWMLWAPAAPITS